jgi:hypothetical protein
MHHNDWIDYDYSEEDSLTDFHKDDRVQVKRKASLSIPHIKILNKLP